MDSQETTRIPQEDAITFFKKAGFNAHYALGFVEVRDGTRTLTTVSVPKDGFEQVQLDAALVVANMRKNDTLIQK